MPRLHQHGLRQLDLRVELPQYDRARTSTGIVHVGVGAFHRAHQAVYVDDLLAAGHHEWALTGVGTMPADRALHEALDDSDCLYPLLTVSPAGATRARVVGSLREHVLAPDDPARALAVLTDARTRVVSLTITEGGYGVDDVTGLFDPTDEATLADLADLADLGGATNGAGRTDGAPEPVRSPLGLVVAALARRRSASTAPFTVMSCDNLVGNGHVARTAVLGFAAHRGDDLAAWIGEHVAFPSSMVDRITPATDDGVRAAARGYGLDDRAPVRSESFTQWVLEDHAPGDRPPWEDVGVLVVPDVEPYELMKLRLLNASHQAMGYLGLLAGEHLVAELCGTPVWRRFLRRYMVREAVPTLRPVPGTDLPAYVEELLRRFGNAAVPDTLERQVVDGSDRVAKFLLPVLRDQLARGHGTPEIDCCVLVLAAWSCFLEGQADDGSPLVRHDRRLDLLTRAVAAEQQEPGSFLDLVEVFGDLGTDPRVRGPFVDARARLRSDGALAVVASLAEDSR